MLMTERKDNQVLLEEQQKRVMELTRQVKLEPNDNLQTVRFIMMLKSGITNLVLSIQDTKLFYSALVFKLDRLL